MYIEAIPVKSGQFGASEGILTVINMHVLYALRISNKTLKLYHLECDHDPPQQVVLNSDIDQFN